MIIYQAQKSTFLHDLHHRDIEEVILEAYRARTGHKVSTQEIQAWASSLTYMGKVLMDDGIPADCGVAIAYPVPQTSKRVDFLITGRNAEQKPCLIIVELKQWTAAHKTPLDAVVTTAFKGGPQQVNHPSYQAWSYAALLTSFNEAVEDKAIRLSPCAYLHNYADPASELLDPFYAEHIARAPLFLKGDTERKKLQAFIKAHVRHGDKGQTLYDIEGGRIRPSRGLIDVLTGLLQGNPEFVLVDDQKLVFETALAQARKAQDKGKRVLNRSMQGWRQLTKLEGRIYAEGFKRWGKWNPGSVVGTTLEPRPKPECAIGHPLSIGFPAVSASRLTARAV